MARLRSLIVTVVVFALAGLEPAFALSVQSTPGPVEDDFSAAVKAPFRLTVRNRTWDGNPHGMPFGSAVLETADAKAKVQQVWELADVTMTTASADGSTVALLTRDFDVFVSKLPEAPRRIAGGPYLSPALSRDGTLLLAQRLGDGDHILDKTLNTRGIALVNLKTGEDRVIVEGNDLYSPSFASGDMVFFGSGGTDQIASLYLLDLRNMNVARVTNREKGARQTFPSETPRLTGGTVVYRADGDSVRVPAPRPNDFALAPRFESPQDVKAQAPYQPDSGPVRLRTPNTQCPNKLKIYQYYDVDRRTGFTEDWSCAKKTYDQHRGTDFNQSYGYDVVAPAAGVVIYRHDGCADSNSPGCGYGLGNHVALQHRDGTVSVEAHGKKWTVVEYGSYSCGDVLMKSASSGNSNAYHIHHDNWKNALDKYRSPRLDPFRGACDPNDASKWVTQNEYGDLPGESCAN